MAEVKPPPSGADPARLQSYRVQLQAENDAQIESMEKDHRAKVSEVMQNQYDQMNRLKQAYEVAISKEAQNLEEHLEEVRMGNEEKIKAEARLGDTELAKTKLANQQKLAEYKKNATAQLDNMKKEFQTTAENLETRAKKAAKNKPAGETA